MSQTELKCPSCDCLCVVREVRKEGSQYLGKEILCCSNRDCEGMGFTLFTQALKQTDLVKKGEKRPYAAAASGFSGPSKRFPSDDVMQAKLRADVVELQQQVARLEESVRVLIAQTQSAKPSL